MTIRVILGSAAMALALALTAPAAQANNLFPNKPADFFPDSNFPAGNFTLSNLGSSASAGVGSQDVRITGTNVMNSNNTADVRAGGFSVSVLNGADRFIAWCLDTFKTLQLGTAYTLNNADPFTNGPSLSEPKKTDIKALFNTAYQSFLGSIASGPNGKTSAGFQLALWEIVNETTRDDTGKYIYNIREGSFRATENLSATGSNDAREQAQIYLNNLNGETFGKGYNLFFLESTNDPASQNLVTVKPVPLPAAGLLMLTGLGAVAAAYRRKQRKAS